MVIIDRKIAYAGGLDFAFGRWDTHSHVMVDNYPLHSSVLKDIMLKYIAIGIGIAKNV